MGGRRPIKNLRWYIGGLLFLSTVINYIDRQTLSVLAPHLMTEYAWTNTDFAMVLIAFRVAYALGQTGAGRVIDHLGTRTGLTLAVAFYSVAAVATSLATGLRSLAAFRFALGLGEAGNWPGATKATTSVASVSGMGGTGAGIGTIAAIYTTGWVADRYSFEPILLGASLLPLVALAALLLLVRNSVATREGVVREI